MICTPDIEMATRISVVGKSRSYLDVFFVVRGRTEWGFCHWMKFSSRNSSRDLNIKITGISANKMGRVEIRSDVD